MEDPVKRELTRSTWRKTRKQTLEGYLAEKVQAIRRKRNNIRWVIKSDLPAQHFRELWEKQSGQCYWTGLPIEWDNRTCVMHPLNLSIDRLDCSVGYVVGNVVLSTNLANSGRGVTDEHEYRDFLTRLQNGNWDVAVPPLYAKGYPFGGATAAERTILSRQHRRNSVFGLISDTLKTARKRHKARWDYASDFTTDDAMDCYDKQGGLCYWTDVPLSLLNNSPTKLSFERLNCSRGYIKGNVVLSSMFGNTGRGDCPVEEFQQILDTWLK